MAARGKLIAIEGIDGSGKRTQLDLLAQALEARGLETCRISFPRYESLFGKLVGQYLNGDFGAMEAVDPHLSAVLYAGDRMEAKPAIEAALSSGKIVLADRYIASNLAHQSARVPENGREEFIGWVKRLEYGAYALPAEDLVIYLRLPVAEAHRLVGLKSGRTYTSKKRDIQEADIRHLEQTAIIYDQLATAANWVRIECMETGSNALRSPGAIHQAVLGTVESRVLSEASPGR